MPDEFIIREETFELMKKCLGKMNPHYSDVIILKIEVKEKFTRVNIQKGSTNESSNNENKGAAIIPDNIKEYLPAYIPDGKSSILLKREKDIPPYIQMAKKKK